MYQSSPPSTLSSIVFYATLFTPLFFFSSYGDHLALHSFPTRRSSDLRTERKGRYLARFCLPALEDRNAIRKHIPQINRDRKSTRLNSSHTVISYAVFCLKKKKNDNVNLEMVALQETRNRENVTQATLV